MQYLSDQAWNRIESVVLVGRLAQIRAFTHQERTAIPGGGGGTFWMVAGPATFLTCSLMLHTSNGLGTFVERWADVDTGVLGPRASGINDPHPGPHRQRSEVEDKTDASGGKVGFARRMSGFGTGSAAECQEVSGLAEEWGLSMGSPGYQKPRQR